ncbi:diacylglycerol O-acyltransferase [Marinobacterium nitratireducens]|uniref:diacylglycerol O-acyltransferase n=2 Tax=Marinobacterium nitratireducens TaxID=518897 RepID=A0A917ZC83_9GAMM|nr:diacylglycerol O-acyltransferase [Marinobacterium nitratireducens]
MDSLFLYVEKAGYQIDITPVFFYDPAGSKDGELTHEQLLERFHDTVEAVPALRSRLERVPFDLDNPYLAEDRNFRIENHFSEVNLPAPGDAETLRAVLADFQTRPLDMDRPLWEVLIVRGLDNVEGMPAGAIAVALKVHHVIADGHTVVEIISRLHDEGQSQADDKAQKPRVEFRAPNYYDRLGQVLSNNLIGALGMMNPLLNSLPRIGKTLLETVSKDSDKLTRPPVSTRFNRKPESKEFVWNFASLDLATAKRISKQETGATINDVVLTVIAGAMRDYMQAKGDRTDDCLRAMAPVNIRQESQRNAGGNEVSFILPDLPVQLADPRERLQAVMRSTGHNKKVAKDIDSREVSNLMKSVPPAWMASMRLMGIIESTSHPLMQLVGNALATNVPGPAVPLHLKGARLLNLAGMIVPTAGLGLHHVIVSYAGKLNISMTAHRDILPDPDFYRECLERSFEQLLEAYPDAAA